MILRNNTILHKLLYVLLLCILGNVNLAAQEPKKEVKKVNEFENELDEFLNQNENGFEEFMKQIEKEFDETVRNYQLEVKVFTDSINAGYRQMLEEYSLEFREFLEEEWSPYYLEEPFETDTASGSVSSSIKGNEIDNYGLYLPVVTYEEDPDFPKQSCDFSFFGEKLSISCDTSLRSKITDKPDQSAITDAWSRFNQCHFNHLLQQFQKHRNELRLNDWGYYILIKKFTEQLYGNHNNSSVALTWFLLLQSSYKARIAYDNDTLIILLPFKQKIYDQKNVKFGNTTYYAIDFSGDSLYTYEREYPGSTQLLDLSISNPIKLGGEELSRKIQFESNRKFEFEFLYNKNLIDFYQTIPHTELVIYLNAPFSGYAQESLIEQFEPVLDTMSTVKQVQFLLELIQESFKYLSDSHQFKYEKPFFPEESLHFPYTDCEDRALFLARLVFDLLGEESLLVTFPGHAVTAFELPGLNEGSSIFYHGKEWILCDPSYIGAPPGKIIPGYSTKNAQVTELAHIGYLAHAQQVKKGLDLNDTIATSQKFQISGTYDKESITQFTDRQGYSYLSGIYYDSVAVSNQVLRNKHSSPGHFIVKSDTAREVVWMTEIPVNTLDPSFDIPFTAFIDSSGLIKLLKISSGDLWHETGLAWTDEEHNTLFNGLFIQSTLREADSLWFEEGRKYDIVSRFMREYRSIEKSGSGTFNAFAWSLLRLLRNKGMLVTGEQMSKFLEEAGIHSTHHLKEVRNVEGVVQLETLGYADIQIVDKVLVKNSAKCRILCFPDRMKVDVIEGLFRGNEFHRDPINYIDIKKNEDHIEFDYSHHYQKKLMMKADIL